MRSPAPIKRRDVTDTSPEGVNLDVVGYDLLLSSSTTTTTLATTSSTTTTTTSTTTTTTTSTTTTTTMSTTTTTTTSTTTTTMAPITTTTTMAPIATTTTIPIVTPTTLPPQCLTDAGCNDGNVCNGAETCQGGTCAGGTPLNCDDGDACTTDTCDPAAGCQHTAMADVTQCSTVIPGGGNKKSDCYVLASLKGKHPLKNPKTLECADGDPSCDMDGTCNNVCALQVRLCVNGPNMPPCTPPSQLASLSFKSHPATFTLNTPGQLTGPECGASHEVNLPVKISKSGKKSKGVLKVTANGKAPKGTKPKSDGDTYVMKCVPGCTP